MVFHSFEIIGQLTYAGSEQLQGHYFNCGFGIGRALDIFLS